MRKDEEIRNRPAVPLETPSRSGRRQSTLVRFDSADHVYEPHEPLYTSREVETDLVDPVRSRGRRVHSVIGQSIRLQDAVGEPERPNYGPHEFTGRGEMAESVDERSVERGAALVRMWQEEEIRARREQESAAYERLRARQMYGPERRNTVAVDSGRRRERDRVVYREDSGRW